MDTIFIIALTVVVGWMLSKVPFVKKTIKKNHDIYLADRLESFTKSNLINSPVIMEKTRQLFESMESVINEIGGPVLDLGCGTGASVIFYPSNTRLWTIDLNDYFHSFLKENMKKSKGTLERHEVGNVEDMSEVFDDNTFSCVVCMKLLCCTDNDLTLREIMRVLKPGGRLFFIEHIIEEPWTFVRLFQILFTPIWKSLHFNCHLDRETDKVIQDFGCFENLSIDIWQRPLPTKFFFARRSCIGYCDKPL